MAYRNTMFNASDAPAMMNVSPYETRAELLHRYATGIERVVDTRTQDRFDDGHRAEALARRLAEDIIGEDLYPVTASEGRLSASFDGLTADRVIWFEHKVLNNAYRSAATADDLPEYLLIQIDQQGLICGGKKCLFMASKWDADGNLIEEVNHQVLPNPKRQAAIAAGWIKFQADIDSYIAPVVVPELVAAPVMSLPALSIRVDGAIKLASNLPDFHTKLRQMIAAINFAPSTDQEFEDATEVIKRMKEFRKNLKASRESAVAQVAPIDEMNRLADVVDKLLFDNAKLLESAVVARKDKIKADAILAAKTELAEYVAGLNGKLGRPYMPAIVADFAGAIKGLSKFISMNEKMQALLHEKMAEADAAFNIRLGNLHSLRELGANYKFLFADIDKFIGWDADAVVALTRSRIAAHDAAEAAKAEALAESARERIRVEEAAKARLAAAVESSYEARRAAAISAALAGSNRVEAEAEAAKAKTVSASAAIVPGTVVDADNFSVADEEVPSTGKTAVYIAPKTATKSPGADYIINTLASAYAQDRETIISWLKAIDFGAYMQ